MAELRVINDAKKLAEHTLRVTSNCNVYPKKYRFSLVDKMQNISLEIYMYLMQANSTDLRLYLTTYGKYIRKISSENKRKIRKRLRHWVKAVKSGKMAKSKFYDKYNAWKNHAKHGNCYKLYQSMDMFVEELMK